MQTGEGWPGETAPGRQLPGRPSTCTARMRDRAGEERGGRGGEGEGGSRGPRAALLAHGGSDGPCRARPPPTRTAISWGRGPLSEEGAGTRRVKCGGASHLSTYCVPGTSRILGPAPDGGGGRGGAGPAPTAASRGLAAGPSPVRAPCPLPGQPVCAPEGVGPGWEGRLESVLCAKQRSPGRAGQGT